MAMGLFNSCNSALEKDWENILDPQHSNKSLLELFIERCSKVPHSIAVADGTIEVTYSRLQQISFNIANTIKQHIWECKKGKATAQYVVTFLPKSSLLIASIIGILKAGQVLVPLGVEVSKPNIQYVVEQLKSPLFITNEQYIRKLRSATNGNCRVLILNFNDFFEAEEENSKEEDENNKRPRRKHDKNSMQTLACCIFNLENPKKLIILLSQTNLAERIRWEIYSKQITDFDKSMLGSSPTNWIFQSEFWPYIISGGTVFIPPFEPTTNLTPLKSWINDNEITVLNLPTLAGLEIIDETFISLRWFGLVGEDCITCPIKPNSFNVCFHYNYPETGNISQLYKFDDIVELQWKTTEATKVYIVDSNLKALDDGKIGEIVITSKSLAQGYLNQPQLTSEKFITNESLTGSKITTLFRTGDLGHFISKSKFIIHGIVGEQLELVNQDIIDLELIESTLKCHPTIFDATVFRHENKFIAYCVPKFGKTLPSRQQLKGFLVEKAMPIIEIPERYVSIPYKPNDADREFFENFLLSQQSLDSSSQEESISKPSTQFQQQLAYLWSKILQIPLDSIKTSDNFYLLGGDSITSSLLISKLQGSPWMLDLTVRTLNRFPLLESFANIAEEKLNCRRRNRIHCTYFVDWFSTDTQLEGEIGPEVIMKEDKSLSYSIPVTYFPSPGTLKTFLLIEPGSFVGINILCELLLSTPHNIYCLLSSCTNRYDAKDRLICCLIKYNLLAFIEPTGFLTSRVICIGGNFTDNHFNLRESEYNILKENVDEVWHFGVEVNFLQSYENLRKKNIIGTKRILTFIASPSKRSKILHYFSNLWIFGSNNPLELARESPEQIFEIFEEYNLNDNGYIQSSRISEKLVWQGIRRKLNVIIYRIGFPGVHSKLANVIDPATFLFQFLTSCKNIGVYPKLTWKIPYGNIDFITKSVLSISERGSLMYLGKCFHIFESQIPIQSAFDLLPNTIGLEPALWYEKLISTITKDPSKTPLVQQYSVVLQLVRNERHSTLLEFNKFSSNNLQLALALDGKRFHPTISFDKYLQTLYYRHYGHELSD